MSFGKSDPPTPPNPIAVAGSQTASNVSTAIANAFLNNTNQVTPQGSLNYDQSSTYTFTDPTTGQTFNIPQFTATQTLSPNEQAVQTQQNLAKLNLAGLSAEQSAKLQGLLGSPFNLSGAPPPGQASWLNDFAPQVGFDPSGSQGRTFGQTGGPMTTFNDAGAITRSYGPADDFSSDRGRVEEALYGRLNPQLARERSNIEQRLADQGINYGSEAYNRAMADYSRQANDARLAVTQTAGEEQKRMMDMAAQRAGFQNAAQQQDYLQQKGRADFYNTAQGQLFSEAQARQQFANQAQQNQFSQNATLAQQANAAKAQYLAQTQAWINAQDTQRSNYLAEQYSTRNQPLNEISALLSGSQVQNPAFLSTPQNRIPTTDIAGLINTNFGQNLDIFKQQSANQNALIGGIFGAAGSALGNKNLVSDRRVKKGIHRVGTVFAATPHEVEEPTNKELPIYEYAYKGDPASTRHIGPMAQDVEKIDPAAVSSVGGVKTINPKRVMGSILRAA